MEKAIVTFKNPDANKEIVIDFTYDKESSNLDYNITLSDNYSLKDNLDFAGFLANTFLAYLQAQEDE